MNRRGDDEQRRSAVMATVVMVTCDTTYVNACRDALGGDGIFVVGAANLFRALVILGQFRTDVLILVSATGSERSDLERTAIARVPSALMYNQPPLPAELAAAVRGLLAPGSAVVEALGP
jgi:hypothetical protein